MIEVTDKFTGEIIQVDTSSDNEIVKSFLKITAQIKAWEKAKNELKELVRRQNLEDRDINGFKFKIIGVQKRSYDLETMRNVLDEDLFNTLIEPNKKLVDEWVKENVEVNPFVTEKLRQSMVDVGQPYTRLSLEKLNI